MLIFEKKKSNDRKKRYMSMHFQRIRAVDCSPWIGSTWIFRLHSLYQNRKS